MHNAQTLTDKYISTHRLRNSNSKQILQLRIFKHLYNKLYGYDPKIQELQTMDQFQAYVNPQIRNAIEAQVDNIIRSKEIANKCSHNACKDEAILIDQFADLSTDRREDEHINETISNHISI